MIDQKTKNLNLPLPHEWNLLQEDVPRLKESLEILDKAVYEAGRIENVSILPEELKTGTFYSIPDDAGSIVEDSKTIKSITVSDHAVSDDVIQEGQVVIVPADEVL